MIYARILICSPADMTQAIVTNSSFCDMPYETGPCRAAIPRYYYNNTLAKCVEFTYGGCGGNLNNFETEVGCNTAAQQWCTMQAVVPDGSLQPTAAPVGAPEVQAVTAPSSGEALWGSKALLISLVVGLAQLV